MGRFIGGFVGALLAVVLLAGGAWLIKSNYDNQIEAERLAEIDAELHMEHEVLVGIDAQGADLQGGSGIPVMIEGIDLDGTEVDETQYVGADGRGIVLRQGSYHVRVPASPLLADGTLLLPAPDTWLIEVPAGLGREDVHDATSTCTLIFEIAGVDDMIYERIEAAYRYASAGGTSQSEATRLRTVTEERRDALLDERREAQEAEQRAAEEAEAQRKAAEEAAKYHVSAQGYQFDLPEYWRDKVAVKKEGAKTIISSTQYKDLVIATFDVVGADMQVGGDIGNATVFRGSMPDGKQLTCSIPRYTYQVAQDALGSGKDKRKFKDDQAEYLVDLVTGGRYNFSDMKEAWVNQETSANLFFTEDEFLNEKLFPTVVID